MPSNPIVLAFDTSAAHCAAALRLRDGTTHARIEERAKGQAERLIPFLEELMAEHRLGWCDLDQLGVGIGPGNFTGIRISVSAARGLALGLGIPAIGVSTLDTVHRHTPSALAAVPAPRDHLYVQYAGEDARYVSAAEVNNPTFVKTTEQMIIAMAEIAAGADTRTAGRPKPLYIKPADAAPSRDTAPVILP